VVDNSGDIDAASPAFRSTGTVLVQNPANAGYAQAVNQAAKQAAGPWILTVNPDIRLLPDSLNHLLDAAERWNAPLAGPRFFWDDARTFRLPPATGASLWLDLAAQSASAHHLDRELFSFYWILRHERFWAETAPFFDPFLSGACLLIRADQMATAGGALFDERFFLYYEDTDLCARALRRGRSPICVPAAEVVHYYDQAPEPVGGKADLMNRSREAFLNKYYAGTCPSIPGTALPPPPMEDMGDQIRAPLFPCAVEGCNLRFEIAVSPFFYPFAQSLVHGNEFQFPEEIWSRLAPGVYYARLRDPVQGTQRLWRWRKTMPPSQATRQEGSA
jgi:GT2 family glycosyltransferase